MHVIRVLTGQLHRLVLVRDHLGRRVDLLLALLGHATTQTKHQVEGRFLLDVVVRKCAAVLELLARKDQALLIRGDALLVLDLSLHVVDRVRGLHIQRDGLARESLGGFGWGEGGTNGEGRRKR